MEQEKKAVWTYVSYCSELRKNEVFVGRMNSFDLANDVCSRLNDTEGLDTSALPELIEAARKLPPLGKMIPFGDVVEFPKEAVDKLVSALTKLTGGKI